MPWTPNELPWLRNPGNWLGDPAAAGLAEGASLAQAHQMAQMRQQQMDQQKALAPLKQKQMQQQVEAMSLDLQKSQMEAELNNQMKSVDNAAAATFLGIQNLQGGMDNPQADPTILDFFSKYPYARRFDSGKALWQLHEDKESWKRTQLGYDKAVDSALIRSDAALKAKADALAASETKWKAQLDLSNRKLEETNRHNMALEEFHNKANSIANSAFKIMDRAEYATFKDKLDAIKADFTVTNAGEKMAKMDALFAEFKAKKAKESGTPADETPAAPEAPKTVRKVYDPATKTFR